MGASENEQVASVYLHMEPGTSSMENPIQQVQYWQFFTRKS